MIETGTELGALGSGMTGKENAVKPSLGNALPYFFPLAIFPLAIYATLYGGWWIAGPLVFLILPDMFDGVFGAHERNMDPDETHGRELLFYNASIWLWAALWPVTLLIGLWQILIVGHLSVWETVLVILALAGVAQSVFIVGHELAHRNAKWERGLSEFLLMSIAYPHYALEHLYGHHANACTPADPGSAPKGLNFWRYFPRDMIRGYTNAWRFACNRLARRCLPTWHYTNPFWRYLLGTGAWFALVYWMGGPWALLIFAYLCIGVAVSLKTINYVQHYGLQRIRLPNGRFEPVRSWHSWSAASQFTNWLFYNIQRHPDHHIAADRRYPLLQHCGGDAAPQLPGSYVKMSFLVMAPPLWFRTMDPLIDRWRERFYPQIKDWRTYESPAFAARPDAFEVIDEILSSSPRLGTWINRAPMLLDNLKEKDFTNLELPDGFGPDPESEADVRRGLTRLFWTREFGIDEMRARIAELPIHNTRDAVEMTRHWANDQIFQIGVHVMRGHLTPVEASIALANVAEASIASMLSVIEDVFASRHRHGTAKIAVVAMGDLACQEAAPGTELKVAYVHDGDDANSARALCRRFHEGLQALSRDSLLFAPTPRNRKAPAALSLQDFAECCRTAAPDRTLLALTRARCIFAAGDTGLAQKFETTRREVLARDTVRDALRTELNTAAEHASEPGLASLREMRGGLREIERAAQSLQLAYADEGPDMLILNTAAIFRAASERGLGPNGAAKRLEKAAQMWQNLKGILKWAAPDDFAAETAASSLKAVIAHAAGADDFEALADAIGVTAMRADDDIKAVRA